MAKELVIESLQNNSHRIFPTKDIDIDQIKIKRQNQLGFHISDSQRFICYVRGLGSDNIVKEATVFVKTRGNADKEYHNMEMLWSQHYFRKGKYVIPKPLFAVLDGQNSLLFVEHFVGDGFLTLFYKRLLQGKVSAFLEDTTKKVARWLADFQSIYRSEQKNPIPSMMLDYRKNLETIGTLEHRDKRTIVNKMNAIIGDCPQYYSTYVHDQFLFRNIIFSERKICVVDFPHFRKGWPLYDFFTFVIGVDRLGQYPFFTMPRRELMKEYFISEYIPRSGIEYDREVFENLWALFVVAHLRQRYRRHSGVRGMLNDQFVNQTLKRLVAWSKK